MNQPLPKPAYSYFHPVLLLALLFLFLPEDVAARSSTTSSSQGKVATSSAKKKSAAGKAARSRAKSSRSRRARERFFTSSFTDQVTEGDLIEGEDPLVRAAAIEALGQMNGTVVAIDPDTGRILAIVNRKLALSEGAQPCSTIKVPVAMAGISEGLVTKNTEITLGFTRRKRLPIRLDLTHATAESNNRYFEILGRMLGFEKVRSYARLFGLGELAGYKIEGEQPGVFPVVEPPPSAGGVGKMCSFGEGISVTPLQLGALISALANGGTLFYLQHPQSPEEVERFRPRIKRQLDIASVIPDISEGLMGAVEYGSARSVRHNFIEEPVLGKTGTCSRDGTRFGWFASWANSEHGRLVTVVFLQGGRPTFGPKAAEIAGRMYRALYDQSFFESGVPGSGAKAPGRTSDGGSH
ncbi:MAG: penicillin-binding transpeptidase domain-containing protein [Terriglobales bacterium]